MGKERENKNCSLYQPHYHIFFHIKEHWQDVPPSKTSRVCCQPTPTPEQATSERVHQHHTVPAAHSSSKRAPLLQHSKTASGAISSLG